MPLVLDGYVFLSGPQKRNRGEKKEIKTNSCPLLYKIFVFSSTIDSLSLSISPTDLGFLRSISKIELWDTLISRFGYLGIQVIEFRVCDFPDHDVFWGVFLHGFSLFSDFRSGF